MKAWAIVNGNKFIRDDGDEPFIYTDRERCRWMKEGLKIKGKIRRVEIKILKANREVK